LQPGRGGNGGGGCVIKKWRCAGAKRDLLLIKCAHAGCVGEINSNCSRTGNHEPSAAAGVCVCPPLSLAGALVFTKRI